MTHCPTPDETSPLPHETRRAVKESGADSLQVLKTLAATSAIAKWEALCAKLTESPWYSWRVRCALSWPVDAAAVIGILRGGVGGVCNDAWLEASTRRNGAASRDRVAARRGRGPRRRGVS